MATGRTHVLSGYVTGTLTGTALGFPASGVVAFSIVAAGAAALNDLDHDHAAASRVLGPVSRLLAETVQAYARLLYRVTRGPGDPDRRGAHRGATHALPLLLIPCAVLLVLPHAASGVAGSVAELAGANPGPVQRWAGPAAVAVVVGFCVLLAADRLGGRVLIAATVAGVVLGVGHDPATALLSVTPWVALAVLVGTVTHVMGDAVTEQGGPWLAPLYRQDSGSDRERRWVRLALPKVLAFRTGGWFERWVVFPALVVAAVLVTPVLGGWLLDTAAGPAHGAVEALR